MVWAKYSFFGYLDPLGMMVKVPKTTAEENLGPSAFILGYVDPRAKTLAYSRQAHANKITKATKRPNCRGHIRLQISMVYRNLFRYSAAKSCVVLIFWPMIVEA